MLRLLVLQALCNLLGGHRTVADKVRGVTLLHLSNDRPCDLPGDIVKLFLDGISAIVSGAALERFDLCVRRQRYSAGQQTAEFAELPKRVGQSSSQAINVCPALRRRYQIDVAFRDGLALLGFAIPVPNPLFPGCR